MWHEGAEFSDQAGESGGVEGCVDVFAKGAPPTLDEVPDGGIYAWHATAGDERGDGPAEVGEELLLTNDGDSVEEMGGGHVAHAAIIRDGGCCRENVGEADRIGTHPRIVRDARGSRPAIPPSAVLGLPPTVTFRMADRRVDSVRTREKMRFERKEYPS